jgi:hypothetical protein
MANEAAPEKKKRKAQGPRVARPIFALVSYTDENGNSVKLDKSRLNIQFERDTVKVLDLVEAGAGDVTVMRVTIPVA